MSQEKQEKGFMEKFEEKLLPIASKVGSNVILTSIRDGFALAVPLLIIGSLFMLIPNFPIQSWMDWMSQTTIHGNSLASYFSAATDATFTVLSIFVIIGIAYSYAGKIGSSQIQGSVIALVSWLMLMPYKISFTPEEGGEAFEVAGLPLGWLGSKGIFIGMICAFCSVRIYKWVVDRHWVITMPAGVPPTVGKSFSSLIPMAIVMVIFTLVRFIFTLTPWGNAFDFVYSILQLPLQNVGASLGGACFIYLVAHLLWFLGIHGTNITDSIYLPILLTLSAENFDAYQANAALPNIVNQQFIQLFATMGGAGSTISLLIDILLFCKSKHLRDMGKFSLPAGIFEINEPVIYGLPIVMNPIMGIPFILTPIVNILITYGAMASGLVPYCNGQVLPWTTPPVFSGFLSCGWRGAVLQIILIAVGCLIYYPFIKTIDKAELRAANEAEKEEK